jgi:hypothetical protein
MAWYDIIPTNPNHASFHELKGHGYHSPTAHLDRALHEDTSVLAFQGGHHLAASISRPDQRDAAGNYIGPRGPIYDKSNRPGEPTWENLHTRVLQPH